MPNFGRLQPAALTLLLLLAACGGTPFAPALAPTVTVAPPPAPAPAPTPAPDRLFAGPGADWLYSAPTGGAVDVSSVAATLPFSVNTHDGGFDYPVQYADGSLGCTTFIDTLKYGLSDSDCVPIPAGGFAPSVGGWGANDGHLIVVNPATGRYYDFYDLYVDGNGVPVSTNVGQIASGSLATGSGVPGDTAAAISGLAGDILPGELDCENCLEHALSVIVPEGLNSTQVCHQAPAQKTDGGVAGAVFCEGAKIQFDPSIDVDSLTASTAVKALMKALQQFGGVITDQTGGNGFGIYSALAHQPDLTGINQIGQHLLLYY